MLKFLRRRSDGTVLSVDDASAEYARRTRATVASDGVTDTVVPAPWEEVSPALFAHLTEDTDDGELRADWSLGVLSDLNSPYDHAGAWLNPDGSHVAVAATAASDVFRTQVAGEADSRLHIHADGSMHWGDGTAAPDISLSRVAERMLELDAALLIDADPTGALATLGLYAHGDAGQAIWVSQDDEDENRLEVRGDGSIHFGGGTAAPATSLSLETVEGSYLLLANASDYQGIFMGRSWNDADAAEHNYSVHDTDGLWVNRKNAPEVAIVQASAPDQNANQQSMALNALGFLLGSEHVSPLPTVGANQYAVYGIDNGSGKTQLMVKFSSGPAQVLATQA